jgi:hypothetical protein
MIQKKSVNMVWAHPQNLRKQKAQTSAEVDANKEEEDQGSER